MNTEITIGNREQKRGIIELIEAKKQELQSQIDIYKEMGNVFEERVAEVGAWGGFGEDLRNVHPAG